MYYYLYGRRFIICETTFWLYGGHRSLPQVHALGSYNLPPWKRTVTGLIRLLGPSGTSVVGATNHAEIAYCLPDRQRHKPNCLLANANARLKGSNPLFMVAAST